MSVLMIGYDLNRPGQKYDELIEFLESQPLWWHYLDSTWLVKTSLTVKEMCNKVWQHVDNNDAVLVLDVTRDTWACVGLEDGGAEWLQQHMDG